MNNRTKINLFKSFFFAFAITVVTYVSITEIHQYQNYTKFTIFSLVIFLIYISEIINLYRLKSQKVQLNFNLNDGINEIQELFNKLLLPFALYVSIILFSQNHYSSYSILIVLLFVLLIFSVLFVNIQFFFEHRVTEESKTHYIYDIIKFCIFFLLADWMFSSELGGNTTNLVFHALLIGFISFLIKISMLWRSEIKDMGSINLSLFSSFILSVTYFIFVNINRFNPLESSLFLLFIFYFSIAIIHHRSLKTLNWKVVFEYASIGILFLAIIYGIN